MGWIYLKSMVFKRKYVQANKETLRNRAWKMFGNVKSLGENEYHSSFFKIIGVGVAYIVGRDELLFLYGFASHAFFKLS